MLQKLVLLFFIFCFTKTLKGQSKTDQSYSILYSLNDSLQYETYPHKNGWGYRIYQNYRPYIQQETLPAVSGLQYIKSEKNARCIAKLATIKFRKTKNLPTLSIKEVNNCQK